MTCFTQLAGRAPSLCKWCLDLSRSSPFLELLLLALQIRSLSASTSGSAYQPSLTFVLLSWRSSTHSWCSRKRTYVFRAAVLQPAGNSFHPVFFFFPFWPRHAICGIFLCTGSREATGQPREGPPPWSTSGRALPQLSGCLGLPLGKSRRAIPVGSLRCFQPAPPWQHLAFRGPLTSRPYGKARGQGRPSADQGSSEVSEQSRRSSVCRLAFTSASLKRVWIRVSSRGQTSQRDPAGMISGKCYVRLFLTPMLGSSVHGILQGRILGWVAIPFSRGSSRPRGWTWVSSFSGRFFTVWATFRNRW